MLLLVALRQIPGKHIGNYVRLAVDDSPARRYGPCIDSRGDREERERWREGVLRRRS